VKRINLIHDAAAGDAKDHIGLGLQALSDPVCVSQNA
jgi:hypothetical protein